jgi:hypothetical protein
MSNFIFSFPTFTWEHYIVLAVTIGYATVGILRLMKGDVGNFIVWTSYASANIGLIMLMK